jgi:hypothetical protein
MKLLYKTIAATLVLFFIVATLLFTVQVKVNHYSSDKSTTEVLVTMEANSEDPHMTQMNENKSKSASVFNYNFLFNLLYKFAYGELTR